MPSSELSDAPLPNGQSAQIAELLEPLLDSATLQQRIAVLGRQISRDFAPHVAEGLVTIGVLKGSFPFYADLVRQIDLPLTCEFVRLSSYGNAKATSGTVTLSLDVEADVAGKHVLIIEDIVDSGLSMQHLLALMAERGAASVSVCTLLHKTSGTRVQVPLRYVGFRIPPAFVVGYGLDYEGHLRNLPYVGVVRDNAEPALRDALRGACGATH